MLDFVPASALRASGAANVCETWCPINARYDASSEMQMAMFEDLVDASTHNREKVRTTTGSNGLGPINH